MSFISYLKTTKFYQFVYKDIQKENPLISEFKDEPIYVMLDDKLKEEGFLGET